MRGINVKIIARTLLLLMPLLLGACGSNVKPENMRPDWVLGQSAKYPAGSYLMGRGQADNMAVAKDRARADLAKIFSVNISEQSKDVSSYTQTGAGVQNTADVSRSISTGTNQVLSGVEISDTWQDPQSQQYYALATLSRAKADASLRQQITDLDASTQAYMSQANGSPDLFDKIAAATGAVNAQQTRAGLQTMLQVVDITGRGIPPQWPLGKLQGDRGALLKQLQITASADGSDADDVKKMLAGALANAGFTVQDGAPYTLTASLNYGNLEPRNGWYWVTGRLQISMNGGTRARGSRSWDLKVSATDQQLVHQRLMDQISQYLQSDLQDTVLGFASGKGSAQQP